MNTGFMHLQTMLKLENHNQITKQTTHPNQSGHKAHIQLISNIPKSFNATRGIEHKIDIPRLGPTKIGLNSLSFIAILLKNMNLGLKVNIINIKHLESEKYHDINHNDNCT